MFFILSKILAFVISPINWITLFLIVALVTKNKKWKKRSAIITVFLFFIFTNQFIVNKTLGLLEVESVGKHELKEQYELGVLLGGMININSDTSKVTFNHNGDRLFQTIDLYSSGYINKVLITSGSGEVQLPSFKEANLIKRYMVGIGIPDSVIITEIESRNTYENAVESRQLINELYGNNFNAPILLITSASHMRRALKCFEKQNINAVPYSTTKRSSKGPFIFKSEMILPDPQALALWKVVNHEVAGLIIYKLQGFI